MKSLFNLLTLVLTCAASSLFETLRNDFSLLNYMLQQDPQRAIATDPATSTKCFAIYLPLLEKVAKKWSADHNNCIAQANIQKDDVVAGMKQQHDELSTAATGICQYVSTCQRIEESMDFFYCFSNLGKTIMGTIYSISNNASDGRTDLVQKLELVDINMYKCTNESERTYITNTANAYDDLDYCLQNGLPIMANTTTTVALETTAEPEKPMTSPEETTSSAEETTSAVEEITSGPAESTAITAETTSSPEETTIPSLEVTTLPEHSTDVPDEKTSSAAEPLPEEDTDSKINQR